MFSARRRSGRRRSARWSGVLQQLGDPAELGQHGAAGGLGGVRGEDGAHAEVADGLAQVRGVGVLEQVGGAGEQAALGGAAGAQLTAAVDLLGDVGQVEVGGEGADQLGGGVQVGVAEQRGGGLAVAAGQGADPFDEVEELCALLADEGLAEQVAQAADVGAQGDVALGPGSWPRRGDLGRVLSALLTGAAPCSDQGRRAAAREGWRWRRAGRSDGGRVRTALSDVPQDRWPSVSGSYRPLGGHLRRGEVWRLSRLARCDGTAILTRP